MSITLFGIAKTIGPEVLLIADKKLKTYVKEQVTQKIVLEVVKETQERIDQFIIKIEKKTRIYFLLVLLGVIPLTTSTFFGTPKVYNVFAFIIILVFMIYMLFNFIAAFKVSVDFVSEFDKHILKALEEKFKDFQEENWKNKVTMLYSGRDGEDYFHHVLSQILMSVSKWVRENKYHLYIRLSSYAIAAFCLSFVMNRLV